MEVTTYFASPEKKSKEDIREDVELVAQSPIINGLLNVISGLFAVLNDKRQVIVVNTAYLDLLGVDDINDIIGLRPGETLNCVHAHEMEGGCGTSQYCPTCGAAIAIVLSLEKGMPVEQICALETEKDGKKDDLYLRVKSCPIDLNGRRILLLFLQDVTHQQKLMNLDSVFFHDISNMVSGLVASSRHLQEGNEDKRRVAAKRIGVLSKRLSQEIQIQRMLVHSGLHSYQPNLHEFTPNQLFQEIQSMFHNHPATKGKTITYDKQESDTTLISDLTMLVRIVSNMVTNALEASKKGENIKLSFSNKDGKNTFSVWNPQAISEDIAKRIFQRNFSTKNGSYRGLGTYSMKLLGEHFLNAEVGFSSNEEHGTEFRIALTSP